MIIIRRFQQLTLSVVVDIKGKEVQLMYQMHEFYKVHHASASVAFFTPPESAI